MKEILAVDSTAHTVAFGLTSCSPVHEHREEHAPSVFNVEVGSS